MAFQFRKITSTKHPHPTLRHTVTRTNQPLLNLTTNTIPKLTSPHRPPSYHGSRIPLPPNNPFPTNIHPPSGDSPQKSQRLGSGSDGISRTCFNTLPCRLLEGKKTRRLPGHMQQQADGKWEKCSCMCMCTRTVRDVAVFCRRVEIRSIPSSNLYAVCRRRYITTGAESAGCTPELGLAGGWGGGCLCWGGGIVRDLMACFVVTCSCSLLG